MARNVSRRSALLSTSAALTAFALPTVASAEPVLLHVSTIPVPDVAALYAGDAQGFFKAENIAITTQAVQSGAFGLPALVSGAFDVLYTNCTSVISALDQNFDLRIVMGGHADGSAPPDPGALVKRKADTFRSGRDLEGKSLGVNALQTIDWVFCRTWVKLTGGDPDKVTFREVPLPSMVDALKNKRVDAAFVIDPFFTAALADPDLDVLGWPASKAYPNGMVGLWVVTGETANKRPEIVRAFVRGLRRGIGWVNANLGNDAYHKLVTSYSSINPAMLAKLRTFPLSTSVTAAQIQPMVTLMRENGLLKTNIDLRPKLFT